MITRRAFTFGLAALLAGCGGGGSGEGPSSEVVVRGPDVPAPVPSPTNTGPWALTVVDGCYILTDVNGEVRLTIGVDTLPGTHVVVDDTVTLYNGGQSPYAIIGRLS